MKYKLFHKQRRFTTILMLLTRPNLYCTAHLHVLRTYKRPGNTAVKHVFEQFLPIACTKTERSQNNFNGLCIGYLKLKRHFYFWSESHTTLAEISLSHDRMSEWSHRLVVTS